MPCAITSSPGAAVSSPLAGRGHQSQPRRPGSPDPFGRASMNDDCQATRTTDPESSPTNRTLAPSLRTSASSWVSSELTATGPRGRPVLEDILADGHALTDRLVVVDPGAVGERVAHRRSPPALVLDHRGARPAARRGRGRCRCGVAVALGGPTAEVDAVGSETGPSPPMPRGRGARVAGQTQAHTGSTATTTSATTPAVCHAVPRTGVFVLRAPPERYPRAPLTR